MVLAQPTRARLFELLREHDGWLETGELAAPLGLHSSGVRVHLERMREADLVVCERAVQPRGRPRHRWRLSDSARARAGQAGAYRQLARWLARSVPVDPARLAEVARTGRQCGHELGLAGAAAGDVAQGLGAGLQRLGFAPASRSAGGTITIMLGCCPFREAVRENQAAVCELHRGLTEGMLDRLDPAARLTAFVPGDPDRAGCRIEVACAGG